MINLNIKQLLDLIKNESSSLPGVYERRLPEKSLLPIYLGLEIPSNLYKFSFIFNDELAGLLDDDGTEGFSISVSRSAKQSQLSKFSINLLQTKYAEIFLILCTDLLNVLTTKTDEERITLINLNKRLDYWRQFLKRSRVDRLSAEAEIGLIGELILLDSLLDSDPNFDPMSSWGGPLGASHDFSTGDVAIEVKTTTTKQKRFVKISSEFQLDAGGVEKLFLAHLEINEVIKSASTFNLLTLINGIKERLSPNSQSLFNSLLACVGYRDIDAHYYDKKQYSLTEKNFYSIIDAFPKLTNENLSPNISDVQYKLNLTGLDAYKANAKEVLDSFLGH